MAEETAITNEKKERAMNRLDRLSHLLDSAVSIPGTSISFGLDGIIGLIPGIGDIVGAILSTYIILEAAQLGVSFFTVLRMIFNVALETAIGSIPVVGDAFDIYFKANKRNVALAKRHLENS